MAIDKYAFAVYNCACNYCDGVCLSALPRDFAIWVLLRKTGFAKRAVTVSIVHLRREVNTFAAFGIPWRLICVWVNIAEKSNKQWA